MTETSNWIRGALWRAEGKGYSHYRRKYKKTFYSIFKIILLKARNDVGFLEMGFCNLSKFPPRSFCPSALMNFDVYY